MPGTAAAAPALTTGFCIGAAYTFGAALFLADNVCNRCTEDQCNCNDDYYVNYDSVHIDIPNKFD